MVPWPPPRGTYSKEVPEGGQEISFWRKEKSQVALAPWKVGRALVRLQVTARD